MNKPEIEERPEQPYVGTRAVMSMSDFEREVPAMTTKVLEWLKAKGLHPSGRPFLRYHVINMPNRMDVELGIPIDGFPDTSNAVENGVLPAGRYAVMTYKGLKNGVPANKKLLDWISRRQEKVVGHDSENGEVFKARYETVLTEAKDEPDQDQWETQIAIKLRD